MPWSVYLLQSANGKKSYTGITTDIERRLKQHNGEISGGAKSTRAHRPYILIYLLDNISGNLIDYSTASKIEHAVKQNKGFNNKLEYIKKL